MYARNTGPSNAAVQAAQVFANPNGPFNNIDTLESITKSLADGIFIPYLPSQMG
jgi:hypothetical protein